MNRRERLLQQLARIPADFSGPRLGVRIAGARIDLVTSDPALMERLSRYFRDYLAEGACEGELLLSTLPERDPEWTDIWEDSDPEFRIESASVLQRDFAARKLTASSVAPLRASALLASGLDDSIHNCLRWFLPELLLRRRSFLMHSAGVVREGRGYLFFGQSGAGKSTSVALITATDDKARPVGDDAVIIELAESGPVMHAAPLGSGYTREAPPAIQAPLAGLFALEQSRSDAIEAISTSEAMASLLASAMSLGFEDDVEARFDLAEAFARSGTPVRRLRFRRTPEFWNLIMREKETRNVEKNRERLAREEAIRASRHPD